jgi:RHS repeat-associated protein
VTDTTGYVATTHKYLPFGEEVQAMKSMDPYKYAGYELDLESGMDYARARYYSSSTGRWLTPDPLGDGYAYVSNNPMNYTDPTGLCGGGPGSITEYCLVTAPFHNVGSSGGGGSRPLYVLGPLDEPKLIPGKSPTPPEPNAFKDCMAANASAFSLAGIAEFIPNYALNAWGADTRVNFKDNAIVSFLGGNEIADFLTAGALPTYDLSQEAFDRGLGVPLSVGRHSTDIRALNVAGKGGRPLALGEAALGIKGLSKTAGNVLGLGLTLGERASIDAALTAIEAVGCAAGAMMSP